jgi:chloride channel protein, CIC family
LGGVEAMFLPAEGAGFWPLVSMAAILGGTMRAPFTAILFALELTHDINVLLPLLVAAILAHATTVLLLKRSILTEKVARRGFHITREYATDPLEILFVREVMRTKLVALPAEATVEDLRHTLVRQPAQRGQHLYPVVDREGRLKGVVTRKELHALTESRAGRVSLGDVLRAPVVAYPEEPLRVVVFRMAESGLTRLPVVEEGSGKIAGMISLHDLLVARVRNLNEERHRERVLQLRVPFGKQHETV